MHFGEALHCQVGIKTCILVPINGFDVVIRVKLTPDQIIAHIFTVCQHLKFDQTPASALIVSMDEMRVLEPLMQGTGSLRLAIPNKTTIRNSHGTGKGDSARKFPLDLYRERF